MLEQPRAVFRGSRSPETLPDGGGAQGSRIWRDGLYSGDERPAAAPQVTAGGVGEDEGIGRPQQWFVAWFAVLVVKLAVPAQSMDRFVEHVHIVAVLSYHGLDREPVDVRVGREPAHDFGTTVAVNPKRGAVNHRLDRLVAQSRKDQPTPRR